MPAVLVYLDVSFVIWCFSKRSWHTSSLPDVNAGKGVKEPKNIQ
jgi:hypothetical protein